MAHNLLLWTARLLAVTVALFFASFARDVFSGQAPRGLALFMHLLPAIVVGLVAIVSWRIPAFGAVAFAALAVAYAVIASDHLDWVAVIAGPLALTALLFALTLFTRPRGSFSA